MAAKPIRLTAPYILLGTEDMSCFCKHIRLSGDEDDALATFCDPHGVAWVLVLDLLMSFGTDSVHEVLTTLGGAGTIVTFEFAYTDAVASAANPHWTGSVRIGNYPIVDAGINEPTEFSLEMEVIGDIVEDVT